ncbi:MULTISPECIES: hypothetical protein [Bacteroides]|uniref:hypothetical protein n=1 Tax=Bacteroides TaxID=816 RepID=UPI001CCC45DD|nr:MULTISPECIES: hypothetical protein [Bacteroides]UBD69875.1 hypothetical protein K6V21_00090 [Bacteroides cellulosilyticus]UVO98512.1 hypothetical protein NXV86_00090 [Bacteroides sp. BFG-257]
MKKKLKEIITSPTTTRRLGDFICNFTAVVLGIIITFWSSDWIEERKQQNEVKKALSLVKNEMMINREYIEEMMKQEIFEKQGTQYLLQYMDCIEKASPDSLEKYDNFALLSRDYIYINDAMEMLKSSALLQSIDNKEIATQLIKTYTAIERAYKTATSYENNKMNRGEKLLDNNEIQVFLIENREKNSWMETWKFLFKYPEGTTLIKSIYDTHSNPAQIYGQYLQAIDEAVAAIEKEYE